MRQFDYSIYDAVRPLRKGLYISGSFQGAVEQTVREKYRNVKCIDGSHLDSSCKQMLIKIPAFHNEPEGRSFGTARCGANGKDVIKSLSIITEMTHGKDSFASS